MGGLDVSRAVGLTTVDPRLIGFQGQVVRASRRAVAPTPATPGERSGLPTTRRSIG